MEENLNEIGENLRNRECPELYRNTLQIQDTLDVLAGKWKIPILFAVLKGDGKFTEIPEFCPGLTDKVLNNRLKDLIEKRKGDPVGSPNN